MKLSKKQISEFQQMIFSWWEKNKRDLPWRRTHDPYRICISEIMLQQTQVSRVLPKYNEFIHSFPTVQALEQSSKADVLRVWKGMGYNRRALYLHELARIINTQHKSKFPDTEKELLKLPGLGKYTTSAILVFAFKRQMSCVDTNIRQIILHFFYQGIPQKESVIHETASRLVPEGKAWEWHQALMDYGAIEMQNRQQKTDSRKKQSIPFRESNRFYRGRIIDLLRTHKYGQKKLIRIMMETYQKPEDFITSILETLEKDGLIAQSPGNTISLPE